MLLTGIQIVLFVLVGKFYFPRLLEYILDVCVTIEMIGEIFLHMIPPTKVLDTDQFITMLMRRKCEYILLNISLFCNPSPKKMIYRYSVMTLAEVAMIYATDFDNAAIPMSIGVYYDSLL
jgi:hypothetical protein